MKLFEIGDYVTPCIRVWRGVTLGKIYKVEGFEHAFSKKGANALLILRDDTGNANPYFPEDFRVVND